ncbi:hypothetical protein C2W62_34445 [Candidatus Entotheonella serta]|nr:hypothetical protein C2W62_34445 [Candidatus Entotheonella serta]
MSEAQAALDQAKPQTMEPLCEGYRFQPLISTYGGVAQHWSLIYSEHHQVQARRTVNKQWLNQRTQEIKAFKKLCRTFLACEADAQHAL